MRAVPFLDLAADVLEVRDELNAAWDRVLRSGSYILGLEVEAFEAEFARYCGADYCVGVASGLAALQLTLEAFEIGEGDEVIVPAYTAVATWMAVTATRARPVGVDVDRTTFNIDPGCVEAAISPRTKAIIAVHLFGRPAPINDLSDIAQRHELVLIEDAAQAHGAVADGRRVGALADAAAFSFYPTKNLGGLGDGGAVVTSDADVATRVRMLRTYGWKKRSVSEIFGTNSRLDELQAALLRAKLAGLVERNARRRSIAQAYAAALEGLDDLEVPAPDDGHVWHVFAILLSDRDRVRERLSESTIATLVHYEPLPHLTPAYRSVGWQVGDFPVAEDLAARQLSLPIYPQLSPDGVDQVVAELRSVRGADRDSR